MKKFLLLLLVMVTVFGIGCSCKEPNPDEPVFPEKEKDEVYISVKQGSLTYTISKEDMYINLKNKVGIQTIVEWADKKIITSIGKYGLYEKLFGDTEGFEDLNQTTYWDLVTDEEIKNMVEKEKYPLGVDNYSEEERAEAEKRFLNNFYTYGYRTEQDIEDYYHAVIAKNKLAKDYQELYRKSQDFSDYEYQKYYKNYYNDKYHMILIPFGSNISYTKTLKELNIKIENGENQVLGKWVHEDTGIALTTEEIIEAYIKIYNNSNIYKNGVDSSKKIIEGEDYTIVEGKYQFNLSDDSKLYYSSEDVRHLDKNLLSHLKTYFSCYGSDSSADNPVWYTAVGKEGTEECYTVLLLSYEEKEEYEDSKDEMKEKLIENEFTSEYVENIFNKMRSMYNLAVYDKGLYNKYINTYLIGSIPEINGDNGDYLLSFMDLMLKKDEFFQLMDMKFGPYISSELVNYYNTLYDKEINKVYDLTINGSEEERIKNADAWNYVLNIVEMEKADFENGIYTIYGYPVSYGWENFLQEIYDVRSDKELAFHYLRENILYDYLTGKYSLLNYNENSLYWEKLQKIMQQKADEYYNAEGFHFVLSIFGENNYISDPEEWTKEQTDLVESFYRELVDYFDKYVNAYKEAIESLETAYRDAPLLVGEKTTGELFDGVMDLSKYKTAGIILTYEDLGKFGKGDYVESLDNAAKELWDLNPSLEVPQVYGKTNNVYQYIKSENGYHVYVNTKNNDMNRFEDRNTPTYDEIQLYIRNSETDELTDEQKRMVENYYETIYVDLIGIYNSARIAYLNQANYELTFRTNNYTSEEYQKTLAITLKETTDKVNYLID